MAVTFRLPSMLRGVPARAGTVMLLAAFGAWSLWPASQHPTPPLLAIDGKHGDRLAFAGDETHIPIREARIYDTIAMFAQPQVEPRAWSEAAVRATMQEAGIKPTMPRGEANAARRAPDTLMAASKPIRTAAADAARPKAQPKDEAAPISLLGWNVPGSDYLPTRRDAARALDTVGNSAATVGVGTVRVVSRTASALGDGVMNAGSAIAGKLGLD